MVDWSEYKSPVQVITNQMQTKLEGQILEAIQNVGVVVDKEELIKAMNYDSMLVDLRMVITRLLMI